MVNQPPTRFGTKTSGPSTKPRDARRVTRARTSPGRKAQPDGEDAGSQGTDLPDDHRGPDVPRFATHPDQREPRVGQEQERQAGNSAHEGFP